MPIEKPPRQLPIDLGVRDAILAALLEPVACGLSSSKQGFGVGFLGCSRLLGLGLTVSLAPREDFLKTVSTGQKEVPVFRVMTTGPVLMHCTPCITDCWTWLLDLAGSKLIAAKAPPHENSCYTVRPKL